MYISINNLLPNVGYKKIRENNLCWFMNHFSYKMLSSIKQFVCDLKYRNLIKACTILRIE